VKKHSFLLLALSLLTVIPTQALELHKVDASHSDVTFTVRHLVSRVHGSFDDFEGTIYLNPEDLEQSRVEFSVSAKSINTNHVERDGHLRSEDFFWVEKHPAITFRSTKIEAVEETRYDVSGLLSIRGVEKEIVLAVSYFGQVDDPWGNRKAGFSTEVSVDRKDFNMVWNAVMDKGGVVLGDEVTILIDLETVRLPTGDGEDS
jgi:polyisoprenoid-binding protein YceI